MNHAPAHPSARASNPGLRFHAELALGGLDLNAAWEIAPGETVVLVGPNGAGKSTCLSIIAGLLRPDCGHVSVGDRVLCDTLQGIDVPAERRRIGLMFQDYALFPHLDVRQNVAYGARLRHATRPGAEGAVRHWMQQLGLTELAHRAVTTLSGGQRQRVALARTLAADPQVLLLDEPFASLDASARTTTRLDLARFLEGLQQPTIVVTHDPVDALTLGQRVLVLEGGKLVQTGHRDELLRRPQSQFVAELAGLNLYVVDVQPGRGLRAATIVAGRGLELHVMAEGAQQRAHAAFAPADVTVSLEAPAGSAQNVFSGVIASIVTLPDRLRLFIDIGVPLMADITREAALRMNLAPGARAWASVKALAIHVYPVSNPLEESR